MGYREKYGRAIGATAPWGLTLSGKGLGFLNVRTKR